MAWKEKPIERLYFTIQEAADEIGVAPSTLRVWEEWFKVSVPRKFHAHQYRGYTRDNINTFKEIHRLLKVEMYTVKGAIRQLELQGNNTFPAFKEDTKALFLDNELRPTSEYSQEAPPV